MPGRLSPQEAHRLQEQEKLAAELRKLIEQNFRVLLSVPQVLNAINEGNKYFSIYKDKLAYKALQKALKQTYSKLDVTILNSIQKEWKYTQDEFWKGMKTKFSKDLQSAKLFEEIKINAEKILKSNSVQARNFYNEKRGGFTISQRVWNLQKNIGKELDVILQNGIIEGKSAAEIARELKPNLNDPDKLFRRVRNKQTGELELSEAAKQYKPGQGVYRSSYKNAERLARTEINRAYRQAEWNAYQSNDLIYAYEIRVSNNSEGMCETCVRLQGTYPKWFLWTGWHPNCRCRMIPINLPESEWRKKIRARFGGDAYKPEFLQELPKQFTEYLNENSDRIKNAATLPYWYSDNLGRF